MCKNVRNSNDKGEKALNNNEINSDNHTLTIRPIGHIASHFQSKFGTPRQSGLVPDSVSRIIVEKEYQNEDYFRGITDFSYLWLIWEFSKNTGHKISPTVRPPRLGGNKRMGVFATRSPYRPNSLGLSLVKLERLDLDPSCGPVLVVSGADLLDGTPIYDIKPYLVGTESKPQAVSGFAQAVPYDRLSIEDPHHLIDCLPEKEQKELVETLSLDPRPSYQQDPDRIYGLNFASHNVRFQVRDKTLRIIEIDS